MAQFDLSVASGEAPAGAESKQFYTENQFTSIQGDTTGNTFGFECSQVIEGTGISVVETSGNLTYPEIIQEVRNNIEPYFFQYISIYANSIDQLNNQIKKVNKGVSGAEFTVFNYPTYLNQSNPVALDVELMFAPKTINKMVYKVQPLESVTLIINYTKGNLNAIADVLNTYIKDGIPFSKSLRQLEKEVTKEEESYLKNTLRKIWEKKKKDLNQIGADIEIEHIFEPQEVIDNEKAKAKGIMMKKVENLMKKDRLNQMKVGKLPKGNVKKLVADYVAGQGADKIYDPYSYVNGDDTE